MVATALTLLGLQNTFPGHWECASTFFLFRKNEVGLKKFVRHSYSRCVIRARQDRSRTTSSHWKTMSAAIGLSSYRQLLHFYPAPWIPSERTHYRSEKELRLYKHPTPTRQEGTFAHSHEREQIAYKCHWMPATAMWKKAGLQFQGKKITLAQQHLPEAAARRTNSRAITPHHARNCPFSSIHPQ